MDGPFRFLMAVLVLSVEFQLGLIDAPSDLLRAADVTASRHKKCSTGGSRCARENL